MVKILNSLFLLGQRQSLLKIEDPVKDLGKVYFSLSRHSLLATAEDSFPKTFAYLYSFAAEFIPIPQGHRDAFVR
ncbi:MAG TPA: hypothetical protein DET40_20625 [Lentisphaeria bacterium]|nr:MAG: hypothetical protein A2X45_16140 [Lentisphaerae bacterium GWF2_50_93]HCE45958.1 hypothetical protein [Lentisphaeria bacterium]